MTIGYLQTKDSIVHDNKKALHEKVFQEDEAKYEVF